MLARKLARKLARNFECGFLRPTQCLSLPPCHLDFRHRLPSQFLGCRQQISVRFFLTSVGLFVLRSLWPVLVLWHVVASTFFFPSSLFHQKPSCPSRRPCRFSIKSLQGSRIIGRFKVGSLHFKRWTFNTVYIITMHLFVNFYHSRAAHYS